MPSRTGSTPDADARVGPARLIHESLPLAGITLSWVVVSWFAGHPLIGTGARYAGVVMAGAYAVVRGVAIARESTVPHLLSPGFLRGAPTSGPWLVAIRFVPPGLVRGNVAAVLAGGAWLLAARLVLLVDTWWDGRLPGLFVSPADGLAFALTATGVLTVLLAAVSVALPLLRPVERREGPAHGSVPVSGDD